MGKRILVENYGYQNVECYTIEGIKNLYLACFKCKKKLYFGLISNSKIVVPFKEQEFIESFATKDRNEFCATAVDTNHAYTSYQLSKNNDGYHLTAQVGSNKNTSCRLVNTIKDEYWFVESITEGIKEYSLYDMREKKILTPGFADISFEEEESRVLAFVEKDIFAKDEDDGEILYLGALLSYIDYKGDFLTPLYMPETDLYYPSISYNHDKTFKSFQTTIENIKLVLYKKEKEKDDHITECMQSMFNNLYTEEELKKRPKARIIEYKKR